VETSASSRQQTSPPPPTDNPLTALLTNLAQHSADPGTRRWAQALLAGESCCSRDATQDTEDAEPRPRQKSVVR
jgi:hypothetical protein